MIPRQSEAKNNQLLKISVSPHIIGPYGPYDLFYTLPFSP